MNLRWFLCIPFGHTFWPTGKRTIGLYQVYCLRCKALGCASVDGRGVLGWDHQWEEHFRREKTGGEK